MRELKKFRALRYILTNLHFTERDSFVVRPFVPFGHGGVVEMCFATKVKPPATSDATRSPRPVIIVLVQSRELHVILVVPRVAKAV